MTDRPHHIEDVDAERLKNIQEILLEIASGNLSLRIQRTERNDQLEALATLINMTLEELRNSFIHQAHVHPPDAYGFLGQTVFLLDPMGRIESFTPNAMEFTGLSQEELTGLPMEGLIGPDSRKKWKSLYEGVYRDQGRGRPLVLSFGKGQGLLQKVDCLISHTIDRNGFTQKTIVVCFKIFRRDKLREKELSVQVSRYRKANTAPKKKMYPINSQDAALLWKIHDHILNNLERPLPSLIELAHNFGTNEFKLKNGFKQLYGDTVFRFLLKERLKKASVLIQHSDLPIKRIAQITGFKSMAHFSRSFKKKYGYPPRDLRKGGQKNGPIQGVPD
ncbi:helix-turn-helix domain-containing protein [Sediminicola luteus]|uniref:HTH araC/xylS-type domain-containing protein n=1 Tax=Sediminicola luteus TaxID=319238 RepID=A0A2A4G214_9FLAO|nr:helix-turn-helix domain-containing protein [Sediminicola luteus]PCE63019.1 hypothetical protein B7P33_17245 [Sediminicola luteus]